MKISFNWLKQYLPLEVSPEEIAEVLPLLGFDTESVTRMGPPPLDNVVVGRIERFEQHPDADRLSVCQVQIAEGGEFHTIVCGAKNFTAGDHVLVALPGAVLPGDFKIKKSKVRGVESAGMMCSALELGVGEDHAGIMILARDTQLGQAIEAVFAEADTVLEVEVTPNRPDCLSHLGIARELAAHYGLTLNYPEVNGPVDTTGERQTEAERILRAVEIDDDADCPYYTAVRIAGVKVGPSPEWLAKAIEAIGLRPINNVVDVTNYILHETGQPLHAFDAAKIRGGVLKVRRALAAESITTLDDQKRALKDRMTVIADGERPLVVAGVMGSVDAEVDATTQDIVLESAYFNPAAVRATSRALGLSTDSSYRFERGVDPEGVDFASLRALDLILETAGGTPVGPVLRAGHLPEVVAEIELSPEFVRKRIGFAVENAAIAKIFESLGLEILESESNEGDLVWTVRIPSFRGDLERPIDLVEEFVRVYGTDKIPQTRVQAVGTGHEDDPVYRFFEAATQQLTSRGFDEALLYSLRSKEEVTAWFGHANADLLRLANPLASDQSHLRPSLLPGLLDVLQLNQARQTGGKRFFERGRIFREDNGVVTEFCSIAFVVLLEKDETVWKARELPDFHAARAQVEDLLVLAGIHPKSVRFEPVGADRAAWQEGHAVECREMRRGYGVTVGLLDAALTKKRWDLDAPVLAGSIYCTPELLVRSPARRRRYTPISLYPASVRDLALIVDRETPAGTVESELSKIASKATQGFNLEALTFFDLYEGKGVPEGKKSLAFSLRFRAADRTLRDDEVNPVFDAIQSAIAAKTEYVVRS